MECIACNQPATQKCESCEVATYCSAKCQEQDWIAYHLAEHECEEKRNVSIGDVFEHPLELVEARRGRPAGARRPKGKRGKKWIAKTHMKEGSFTRKAKGHKMSTAAFREYVLSHKDKFDTRTVREAVLARTLAKLPRHHGPRK